MWEIIRENIKLAKGGKNEKKMKQTRLTNGDFELSTKDTFM